MNKTFLIQKREDRSKISTLLEKTVQLGLTRETLEQLAIQRGCDYYQDGESLPYIAVTLDQFSNEELLVALMSPSLSPTPRAIRIAGALLGAQFLNGERIAKLAESEDCSEVVRYIANCGQRFEPNNLFWPKLLTLLPGESVNSDRLPHPTRFVEMTGINRGHVGVQSRWIRPRPLPV